MRTVGVGEVVTGGAVSPGAVVGGGIGGAFSTGIDSVVVLVSVAVVPLLDEQPPTTTARNTKAPSRTRRRSGPFMLDPERAGPPLRDGPCRLAALTS
jgi:hypothetical protein